MAILSGRPVGSRGLRATVEFVMTDVSLWRLSAQDRPLERVEAPRARLAIDSAPFSGDERVAGGSGSAR